MEDRNPNPSLSSLCRLPSPISTGSHIGGAPTKRTWHQLEDEGAADIEVPTFKLMNTRKMPEYGYKTPDFQQIRELLCKYPTECPFVRAADTAQLKVQLAKQVVISAAGHQLLMRDSEGLGKATIYKSGKITIGGNLHTPDRTVERFLDWASLRES